MSQRSIAQLIKRQVIHLTASACVREAAQLMSEHHTHSHRGVLPFGIGRADVFGIGLARKMQAKT